MEEFKKNIDLINKKEVEIKNLIKSQKEAQKKLQEAIKNREKIGKKTNILKKSGNFVLGLSITSILVASCFCWVLELPILYTLFALGFITLVPGTVLLSLSDKSKEKDNKENKKLTCLINQLKDDIETKKTNKEECEKQIYELYKNLYTTNENKIEKVEIIKDKEISQTNNNDELTF